jgi:hypothetical protein
LVPGHGYREQELAFERLIAFHGMNYVAQHHIMFSATTAAYCNTFSIKPIVSYRNFFDCVPSVKDWFDRGGLDNIRHGPVVHIPTEYFRMPDKDKFDFIIDMMMPWYSQFIIGWQECSNCVSVNYEKLATDPMTTLADVSDKFALGLSRPVIEGALERAAQRPTKKEFVPIWSWRRFAHSRAKKQNTKVCVLLSGPGLFSGWTMILRSALDWSPIIGKIAECNP